MERSQIEDRRGKDEVGQTVCVVSHMLIPSSSIDPDPYPRLEVERNPSLAPPLNEKQLHKLTLKKRKAKKMALAKCNGTQLADMKPIGAGVLGKRKVRF